MHKLPIEVVANGVAGIARPVTLTLLQTYAIAELLDHEFSASRANGGLQVYVVTIFIESSGTLVCV